MKPAVYKRNLKSNFYKQEAVQKLFCNWICERQSLGSPGPLLQLIKKFDQ